MVLNLFVLLVVLSIVLMGIIVFLRNSKDRSGLLFAIFCMVVGVWVTANYLGANFKDNSFAYGFLHADFFLGVWLPFLFYLFTKQITLPESKTSKFSKLAKPFFLLSLAVSILSLGNTFVKLSHNSDKILQITYTNYYDLYALCLFSVLGIGVYMLVYGMIKAKGSRKNQLVAVTWGLAIAVLFVAITNLILPTLTDSKEVNLIAGNAAYLAIAFFVFMTTYAIAKHKLFDIRSFVFRAVVYILSISLVASIYSLFVYGLGGYFIDISNVTYVQRIIFAMFALVIAVTYSPILKFFNKVTTKFFFRDAYDTQVVLDEIGKIIVGSIDLQKIQKSALKVFAEAIKPTYLGFILKSQHGGIEEQDYIGENISHNQDDLLKITNDVTKRGIVYDELNESIGDLAMLMRKNDISFIVPLITKNETIGYLVSGPKKSGNIFNQQDKSMINIAANELAVAIQNAQRFEEIQAFNLTLQEKVNEATRELKSTNKKLVELDEAKDEFISMASHQLRTPLTSIKGYLSMILDGDMGKLTKDQTSALKEAFGSSQRMVFLISDFLNVSRIKTGKFVIEKSEVNLATMVHEELTQLKELAESRNVAFKYDQPKEFPIVKLDDNKIRQVMMNMIDNAIYYTPVGGTVTVQLYVDDKDVVFKVIDTGIGVPKAERHKLFTKFFRAANARVARPDGTGLGLFMAQKVILAQGGSIIFESEEGKGSTFGWRFPINKIKP